VPFLVAPWSSTPRTIAPGGGFFGMTFVEYMTRVV